MRLIIIAACIREFFHGRPVKIYAKIPLFKFFIRFLNTFSRLKMTEAATESNN